MSKRLIAATANISINRLQVSAIILVAIAAVSIGRADEDKASLPGGIRLLESYEHQALQGIDTTVGRIFKKDGVTIRYDIGMLSLTGNYAKAVPQEKLKWFKQQEIAGQVAQIAMTKQNELHVTILEQPNPRFAANFSATVDSPEDVADVLLMVLTYSRLKKAGAVGREKSAVVNTGKSNDTPKEKKARFQGKAKTVVVDNSKFSDVYPAVWFNPCTGEIAPVKDRSERPPEKNYEIWIEPNDPEFGYNPERMPQGVGFARVGEGREAFENPKIPAAPRLKLKITHLMKESEAAKRPVFYCKATTCECLIMVTAMDREKELIRFQWRALRDEE